MSILMLNTGVFHLPVFQLLRDDFVQALQGAARATSLSTDDMGDYFNMTLASKMPLHQVADDATVLVPLFNIDVQSRMAQSRMPRSWLCTPGSWVTPSLEWCSHSALHTRAGWNPKHFQFELALSFPRLPTSG
jgi:hypothetical protein